MRNGINNEGVGQKSIAGYIRQDVVNKMARSSQIACNRLCVAKDIRDIHAAFGECQNATEQWIFGLADSDLNAAEMKVTLVMLEDLLGRLVMRGRQLEQWFVGLTGYGSKGKVLSVETNRLINYMRGIIYEWENFKIHVAKDIAERYMVKVIGINRSEAVQEQSGSDVVQKSIKLQGLMCQGQRRWRIEMLGQQTRVDSLNMRLAKVSLATVILTQRAPMMRHGRKLQR